MNDHDPPPLMDPASGAPRFLRDALASARADVPHAGEVARLAARLPLGASPPPPGTGFPHRPETVEPPPVAAPPLPSTLSGALIGAALGVLVAGAGFVWEARREAGAPAPPPVAAVRAPPTPTEPTTAAPARDEDPATVEVAPAKPATAPSALPPAPPSTPALAAGPSSALVPADPFAPVEAAPPPAPVAAAPGTPGGGPGSSSDLRGEVELLTRARALVGPSPAQALALTQEHATRYARGALGQEREVLAIQALHNLGRTAEARARRARFMEAYPRSAHRHNLEALLGP